MLFNELVRGGMVGTIRPGTIDKGLRSLWQSIPRLSGGFIRMVTASGIYPSPDPYHHGGPRLGRDAVRIHVK